jgi:hypothetical protein
MPAFIIHIGPHKTGTTYLQLSLKANRQALLSRGIIYPEVWDYAPGNPSHLPLMQKLKAGDHDGLAPAFSRLLASGAQTILLSAEDLSNLDAPAVLLLQSLLAGAAVKIVFYVRRWSELLPSSWQESIKQGQAWTLPEYMLQSLQNVTQSRLLNFERKIAPFTDVFGESALHVVSYSELREREIDMFQHFAAQFLDWPDAVPGGAPPRANESRDLATIEILRMMNVMSRARNGAAIEGLRQKFDRLGDRGFLAPVIAAIEAHAQTQRFNDNWPALHALHTELAARYHDRLVAPKRRHVLFAPKTRQLAHAGAGYLTEPGVVDTLTALHGQLCQAP